mmetsp:Transcript_38701/g.66921  ORF Transcript_38701/g.66921 Transcript_38701/m.66921 type:complete len:217 (-) Transcript_38701:1033-1683(-)
MLVLQRLCHSAVNNICLASAVVRRRTCHRRRQRWRFATLVRRQQFILSGQLRFQPRNFFLQLHIFTAEFQHHVDDFITRTGCHTVGNLGRAGLFLALFLLVDFYFHRALGRSLFAFRHRSDCVRGTRRHQIRVVTPRLVGIHFDHRGGIFRRPARRPFNQELARVPAGLAARRARIGRRCTGEGSAATQRREASALLALWSAGAGVGAGIRCSIVC